METILDKVKMDNLPYTSRYRGTYRLIYEDETECQETNVGYDFPPDDLDRFYEVNASTENRLDLVATKFFGNPLYWWVIAMASDITDPSIVPIGTILRIPSPDRLFSTKGVLR